MDTQRNENDPLLTVRDLATYFYERDGVVKAVDGVDFEVLPRETVGIVGESGSGKSVTSLSIMRLVKSPPGKIVEGQIELNGTDLLKLPETRMRRVRGKDVSMVFQEPMSSLDPLFPVGKQITEAIHSHNGVSKAEAEKTAMQLLARVGLPSPEQRFKEYPHQYSGGMGQRAMIAMALSCNPQLLIADEPTTALDVTTQDQILQLLDDLKAEFAMAILLITHDLAVVAQMAQRVAVMYAGEIVEYTDVKTIFDNPRHPYAWGLVGFVPRADQEQERLVSIPGTVPNPKSLPSGCRFHPRCPLADQQCVDYHPRLENIEENHLVRCWHHDRVDELAGPGGFNSSGDVK